MPALLLGTIFTPLVGAVLVLAFAPFGRYAVRQSALVTALLTLGMTAVLLANSNATHEPFAASSFAWLGESSAIDIRFAVALDGLSLWMFGLSSLLLFTSVLVSWEAITDRAIRAKYHFGAGVESEWTPGSRYALTHPGADGPLAEGENLVVDPPRRLVQTMHTLWSEEAEHEGTSRVTWEIEPVGDSCRLTVTHDQLRDDAPPELYGGWPMILSGLKTWLETGQTLTTPGSLMYGQA